VGVPTKSPLTADRRGLALPSAMFALVAIAILLAGIFVFADLQAKAVQNRVRATRAEHVAEAGVNHALGLLRGSLRMYSFSRLLKGSDNVAGNADDSLFTGYGLAAGDQIPLAGQNYQGHTYFVSLRDDPADGDASQTTDLNGRVKVRCRAVTTDGSTAEVEAIIGAVPQPGIATDGNLSIGNSNTVSGECGGIHANGNLSSVGGGPTISGTASATGVVTGSYGTPGGTPATTVNGAPEVPIPDLNPMNFCAGTDFTLLLVGGLPFWQNAAGVQTAGAPPGWAFDVATQTWIGTGSPTLPAAGTYCSQQNLWLTGSVGSAAAPKSMSLLSAKSIKVDGTPYIQPDHLDGILLMAGGDIYVAGNNTTGAYNYQGLIYAGAQCTGLGNVKIFGQLLCANGPQPVGATEYTAANTITGNLSLTFDCSGNVFNKRRILFWYPRIGT
jgi:hypothetical protein